MPEIRTARTIDGTFGNYPAAIEQDRTVIERLDRTQVETDEQHSSAFLSVS
jgi:hypothetical protein